MSSRGRGFTQVCAAAILSLGLAASAFSGASPAAPAGAGRKGREVLNLSEATIAGTKVYCEKALEPNLPVFEQELRKSIARRDKLAGVLAKQDQIVADINRILGATDPNVARQRAAFASLAGAFSGPKLTFCLAKTTTIKDFLRNGGQLPDFHYDRQSDTVEYRPQIQVPRRPSEKPVEGYELWIPVRPQDDFAGYISKLLSGLGLTFGSAMTPVAIHEVTEMTLLNRARPADAHWRWFSDGFANAITCTLAEKYLGKEARKEFASAYDPNDYRNLEKQINLRYWMLANYCPYVTQVPVKAEADLQSARYAYATFEAQRLIDKHGIGCVRAILDKIVAKDLRTRGGLLQAIREVTGEDMDQRLQQYQAFSNAKEGSQQYVAACKAASEKKDHEQMFVNLMRVLEMHPTAFSESYLQEFSGAALLLFRMGHEEAADQAMQNCIELYSWPSVVNGRQAVVQAFIFYCLESGKPRKGEKMADELLAIAPDHLPALALKMLASAESGNTAGAQDYAKRLRRLAKPGDPAYQAASKILGLDPNAPPDPKESAGTK